MAWGTKVDYNVSSKPPSTRLSRVDRLKQSPADDRVIVNQVPVDETTDDNQPPADDIFQKNSSKT
ncbi:hypothetical protein BD779DRAFT_1679676 [Infundibulicybe gibba]|nr:hypothetical protein BD779DRAFT_1679676 [Infundibulicybe gibba]